MKNSTKTSIGFALVSSLVVLITFSSLYSTSKFIEDFEWMLHSASVRGEIDHLSTQFMTGQNNLRAFHVTGQDYYRNNYANARMQMTESLNSLREITKDNEVQQKNVALVSALFQEKMKLWAASFAIRKKEGWEGIRERMKGDESKNQDRRIFDALDALQREEDQLMSIRTQNAELQGERIQWIVGLGGLVAFLTMALGVFLVYRNSRRSELAEEQIDRFFNLSLDLLCISGMDGYFKRLSPSYSKVLGYSLREMYDRPILDFIHPEDVQKTVDEIEKQANGQSVLSFENRFRKNDGTYRVFSWKSVPVDGFMYAVARDVTRQKEFEMQLVEAREAAFKAAIAKSSFLANMSHEIRTPLNGVVGMTDLLGRTELNGEQGNLIDGIRGSTKALLNIVNEILDFSKIESGRMNVEKIDFDLSKLIDGQISVLGIQAAEKKLKLKAEYDSKLPQQLRGDPGKIGQVTLNLINNAIKFTSSGEVSVKVDVESLANSKCRLKLSVRDTGIGLKPELKPLLFEPFAQADSSTGRRFGGTGLGLSICKRLVELMGGEIGVNSEEGNGAEFWFRLALEWPLADESVKTPEESVPKRVKNKKLQAQRKNFNILIAEDNTVNQMVIMSMMKALGFPAVLAKHGQEAVDQFKSQNFQLILMDQHMPVMDGLQASKEIREQEKERGGHIPIIAFTVTVIQENEKAERMGIIDDYLLKPVSLENLENMLETWQERSTSRPHSTF